MLRPDSRAFTALLGALTMMTSLAIDMSLPALPALSEAFDATPDHVQLTLSLFLVGYAVAQIVYGPLSDRFGRRRVLLLGLGIYTVSGFACAFSPRIDFLVAARLVQGFGACAGPVLGRAVVRDHFSGARASHMLSAITMVFALGPLVGPVLGGWLLAAFDWRAIFLSHGFAGIALSIVTWTSFAESLRQHDPLALKPWRLLSNYAIFFSSKTTLGYALLNSFAYCGIFAFISGSPFVLIDVYRVPSDRYGFYFGMLAVGLVAGAWVNRRLLRHSSGERILQLGIATLLFSGALELIVALTPLSGALSLTLPFILYVFAQALVMPNAIAAAMEPLHQMAGVGASLLSAIQMSFGSAAGYAVDALYDGTPLSMSATMAAAAALTAALYGFMLRMSATI